MRRFVMALVAAAGLCASACGGNPCEKLVKYYCEEKKDKNLCETFTNRVNEGMSKEACESTLSQAK